MIGKYLADLRTWPHDAAWGWQSGGIAGLWEECADRTLHRVWRRNAHLLLRQQLASVVEVPPPGGIRVEPFSGPDWSVLEPIASRKSLAAFARASSATRTCFVAWRGAQPLGYGWVGDRAPALETYGLELPPDAAWYWGLYVSPGVRGLGIGAALLAARQAYARQRGFREAWQLIPVGNEASLRSLAKTAGAGSEIVGTLRATKILRRMRARFTPCPEGPRTVPSDVPAVRSGG
ncbi:MAG TPA: GNAT family N-acetyltransferase [Gemmatimonadales bacterium]|nr:GNAT family N-acetyltransferase [Gemmatimonadales bacterium]